MAADEADRTEAATARRLARAREEGQAPVSREATAFAVLAVATLMLMLAAGPAARRLTVQLAALLAGAHRLHPAAALRMAGAAAALAAGPFMLAGALAGIAAVLAQTGLLLHFGALQPDLARLDPRRGLGRVFSVTALTEGGKALLKLTAAGAVCVLVLRGALPALPAALGWPPLLLLEAALRQVLRLLLALLGVQAAIAAFDLMRTRAAHARDLRMTRQEVRDEHKETEGNPQVRARIRRLRLTRARRRMLQAVPKAAVVVTNPTHYAVALAYQRGAAAAPRVVAKGSDEVAGRIRDLARAHGVPLVANPPLARALHAVELDAEIPRELYQAVAELIAYVWRLRSRAL